eukprot:2794193-Prymnesium_polylepis.1
MIFAAGPPSATTVDGRPATRVHGPLRRRLPTDVASPWGHAGRATKPAPPHTRHPVPPSAAERRRAADTPHRR